MNQPTPIHTIAIFPKVQPDTVIAVFLLHEFGEKEFPGIRESNLEFWTALPAGKTAAELEAEGTLPIDLGGGMFDHHHERHGKREDSAATLVAKYLGVEDDPSLRKLLAYAKRDDLEGKGTISNDPLDRAFGLSGLITTLGRVYKDRPDFTFSLVLPMIRAHYLEERKRREELPAEWKQLLKDGRAREELWQTPHGKLRVAIVESENISLPGFLRAYHHTQIVIQRLPSSHTNFITNQQHRHDLRPVIRELRRAEAEAAGTDQKEFSNEVLERPGRLGNVPEWFYDTAANTLQNGGIAPQDIPATRLSLERIIEIARKSLGT